MGSHYNSNGTSENKAACWLKCELHRKQFEAEGDVAGWTYRCKQEVNIHGNVLPDAHTSWTLATQMAQPIDAVWRFQLIRYRLLEVVMNYGSQQIYTQGNRARAGCSPSSFKNSETVK